VPLRESFRSAREGIGVAGSDDQPKGPQQTPDLPVRSTRMTTSRWRAVRRARRSFASKLLIATARYHPMRTISAKPRASLGSVLVGRIDRAAWACRVSMQTARDQRVGKTRRCRAGRQANMDQLRDLSPDEAGEAPWIRGAATGMGSGPTPGLISWYGRSHAVRVVSNIFSSSFSSNFSLPAKMDFDLGHASMQVSRDCPYETFSLP
jgi:hypothetical protein